MKAQFIYILISFLPFTSLAQAGDTSVSESMSEAAFHYGNTEDKPVIKFEVKREPVVHRRAFKVNTASTQAEVHDKALGFARMIAENYKEDKKKGTITFPVNWQYNGGFNECIENLELTGQLLIEVKDIKTRISLTNISYKHHDKREGDVKPVAKSDFFTKYADCAPSKGKVELLYNCKDCSRSVSSIDKHLQLQFDDYADQYQEWLKKY